MANLAQIYDWFMTGKKPTQAQFWASWGSFWNKEETIPQSAITNLTTVLAAKTENDQFNAHKVALDAHTNLFLGKEDKDQKGAANGYSPLDATIKIASQYLNIVNDLVTGGATSLASAETVKILKTQINAINLLLTSDNLNLDTVQEIVDAIETVQTSLSTILVNDLTTGGTTKALTAEMGKTLKGLIDVMMENKVSVFIKSNESLALSQRRGDVLYGILDQYTGEEITLSKVSFTTAVDGIIYFQMGNEYFKRNYVSYLNVKWFGAIPNGVVDCSLPLSAAIQYNQNLYFPRGTYKMTQRISLTNLNTEGVQWLGEGSKNTRFQFTTAITSGNLIDRTGHNSAHFSIKGIGILGAGKTFGTSINGFYSKNGTFSMSYNLIMDDVAVFDVSGTGFIVLDWFQQTWRGCFVMNIGQDGFDLGGDQATNFTQTGSWCDNVDGYVWRFRGGSPTLIGLNAGPSGNGLRLGRNPEEEEGAYYCHPYINGLNIEGVNKAGGIGIYVAEGSNFASAQGISIYAYEAAASYGIYMRSLGRTGMMIGDVMFFQVGAGTFGEKFRIEGSFPINSGIIHLGSGLIPTGNGSAYFSSLKMDGGQVSFSRAFDASAGIVISNLVCKSKIRTIYEDENIFRDGPGIKDDYIILVNANAGPVILRFDYAIYLPFRNYVIKKIDNTANTVRVLALGNIDGVPEYTLTNLNQIVEIGNLNLTNDWIILNKT